jgi:hypothetical protein
MRGDNRGKYTDIGERYFEEFNTLFWFRPGNKRCLISLFTFIYIHNYIHFIVRSIAEDFPFYSMSCMQYPSARVMPNEILESGVTYKFVYV